MKRWWIKMVITGSSIIPSGCLYLEPIEGQAPADLPFLDRTEPLEREVTIAAPYPFLAIISPGNSEHPIVSWWIRSEIGRRHTLCDENAIVVPKDLTTSPLPQDTFTVDPIEGTAGTCPIASGTWNLRVVVSDEKAEFDIERLDENASIHEYAWVQWPLEIQAQ